MKLAIFVFGGVLTLVMSSLPIPGLAFVTDVVHDDYSVNTDTVVGTASNGDMAIVEANTDDTGVNLWVYDYDSETWYDEVNLTNTTVDNSATQSITNLSVIPAPKHWLMTWQVNYYDETDTFINVLYHTAHISRQATGVDTTIPEMMSSATVSEGEGTILAIETSGGEYNDAYIIWADGSDIKVAGFYGLSEQYTTARSLTDAYDPTNFRATTVEDSLYLTWRSDNKTVQLARFTNDFADDLVVDFQRTISDDERSRPLHAVVGKDGQVFVLYQMGSELKRVEVNADGSLGDRDIIFKNVNRTLRSNNVAVTYNNYGKGQYDIVMFDGSDLSSAHWSEQHNWTRQRDFHNGNALHIRPFIDGHIQLIWSHGTRWYYKEYSPDTKTWTDKIRLRKNYGSLMLQSPLKYYPHASVDGTKYIELFKKSTGSKQEQLRLWKIGTTFADTDPKAWLPEHQSLIYRSTYGDYYFLLFKKKDQLRSVVMTEEDLFN